MIPIYKPRFSESLKTNLMKVADSGWFTSGGEFYNKATQTLSKLLKQYVLLTANGTCAMDLVALCLKEFRPKINSILVPNNCYVAAYNMFIQRGLTLILAKVDTTTWNANYSLSKLDPDKTAILVVHNVGNVVNVAKLKRQYPDFTFVEDACEAFNGTYEGKPVGSASLVSGLSFFANKTITSGEGGLVCSPDPEVMQFAHLIHGQGMSTERYIHSHLGFNYRATNLMAAILCSQLEDMQKIIRDKSELFAEYRKRLAHPKTRFQVVDNECSEPNWMMGIRLLGNPSYKSIQQYLIDCGVDSRPMFYGIDKHPYMGLADSDDPNSRILEKECLMIPSYPDLLDEKKNLDTVINSVLSYCDKLINLG